MKKSTRILSVILTAVMALCLFAACGGAGGSEDILTGAWKQTDEENGNWVWTFDGKGKCVLEGETTGIKTDGTYQLNEEAGTLTVNMDLWDDEKVYSYTLSGDTLDLSAPLSSYHLIKQ